MLVIQIILVMGSDCNDYIGYIVFDDKAGYADNAIFDDCGGYAGDINCIACTVDCAGCMSCKKNFYFVRTKILGWRIVGVSKNRKIPLYYEKGKTDV